MKIADLENTDILYRDIEARIKGIKDKKNLYLTLHRATRVIIFFFGAIITILTGWQITVWLIPKNAILIISATISLLTAIEGLFSFKDKGKSNDLLLFELRRLRDRICFVYTDNPEIYKQNKGEYFEVYQTILNSKKTIIENSDNEQD